MNDFGFIITRHVNSELTNKYWNNCIQCLSPCPINVATATKPFYFTNTIDPLGQLFGNTQWGELNYTHYMRYKKNV